MLARRTPQTRPGNEPGAAEEDKTMKIRCQVCETMLDPTPDVIVAADRVQTFEMDGYMVVGETDGGVRLRPTHERRVCSKHVDFV